MSNSAQFLSTQQLASRYGLKPATIVDWRKQTRKRKEIGPKWYQLSRTAVPYGQPVVRYDLHQVLAWEESENITPIKAF